jgi:uncharacterized protein
MRAMATKNVLLLSDGKPGHFQLAEGIVAALVHGSHNDAISQRPTWSVTRLGVERPWWQPTRAWSMLTNSKRMAPERALSVLSGKSVGELQAIGPFQLVVSAGGDTLAANVAAKRMFQCTNIFYGSLRRYPADAFSLVLTSYAAQVQHANQAMTLKPSAFDPDALRTARAFLQDGASDRPVLGLLVGGDSGTVRFGASDWASLLALLAQDHPARPQWVVGNSRRTPTAFSNSLADLAALSDRVQFIDVRTAGPGTLLDLLDRCDAIAVSVDSSSMVSEAVWSRRRVVVLEPKIADLPPLETDYRAYMVKQSLIGALKLEAATIDLLLAEFARVTPLADNPLEALSNLLSTRLPELSLR